MTAVFSLAGFALFGWATGGVFRVFFRGRRFGLAQFLMFNFLLIVLLVFGGIATLAVMTAESPSTLEQTVMQVAAWPLFLVVAIRTYSRRPRTKASDRAATIGAPTTQASSTELPPPPPPASLPQPF